MRIGILTRSLPPHVCGIGDHTLRFANALRAMGHNVLLFAGCGAAADDVRIVGDEWNPPALQRLVRSLDATGLDRLVLQYTPLMFSEGQWQVDRAITDFFRTASARWPTSLIAHEAYFRQWRNPRSLLLGSWQKTTLRTLARTSDHVFSASEPLVKEMSGWGLKRGPIRLPIGSNTDVVPADPAGLRHSYALNSEDMVLTLFGCSNNLRQMLPHLHFLESRLNQCGLAHAWLLLGGVPREYLPPGARILSPGRLPPEALSAHLQMSDIFLMPHFGGISAKRGTLMTAMAHGLPIVGTSGAMTDAFWSELPGVSLYAESSIKGFAEGVLEHCRCPCRRRKMGVQNVEFFRTNFTWSIIARRFLGAIQ